MSRKRKKRDRNSGAGDKSHNDGPAATIALIIALPEERQYFHDCVSNRNNWTAGTPTDNFECWYDSSVGSIQVKVSTLSGMGHIPAILRTTSAITALSPDLTIMLGIAGSMQPDTVELGDVVVSNRVKFYASDKVACFKRPNGDPTEYKIGEINDIGSGGIIVDARDKFLDDSFFRYARDFVESSHADEIISMAEHTFRSRSLSNLDTIELPEEFQKIGSSIRARKIHMGWVLGVHHVVDSKEYREYLNEKNKKKDLDIHIQKKDFGRYNWKDGEFLAVDMESYGHLKAVELARTTPSFLGGCSNLIGGLVVRGISDLCEEKGYLDKNTKDDVRRLAASNATEVALTIIESINYEEIRKK